LLLHTYGYATTPQITPTNNSASSPLNPNPNQLFFGDSEGSPKEQEADLQATRCKVADPKNTERVVRIFNNLIQQ